MVVGNKTRQRDANKINPPSRAEAAAMPECTIREPFESQFPLVWFHCCEEDSGWASCFGCHFLSLPTMSTQRRQVTPNQRAKYILANDFEPGSRLQPS